MSFIKNIFDLFQCFKLAAEIFKYRIIIKLTYLSIINIMSIISILNVFLI